MLAHAYTGIVALGDDVGQPAVEGQLDLDVGIVGKKPSQLGPQDVLDRVVDRRDANGASWLIT